jgi:hypothetical protein
LVAGDQGSQGRERATDGENYAELRGRVADYLAEWLEAHAGTVKPKTLPDTATTSTVTSCPGPGECGSRHCGQG